MGRTLYPTKSTFVYSAAPYNVHVKVGTFENVTEGESKAVVVPKGIPLTLTCSFPDDVHPAPVVRWTRDGVVLDEDSTSLVLQDPNGGMYSCSVSNQVESASSGNVTLLLKGMGTVWHIRTYIQ